MAANRHETHCFASDGIAVNVENQLHVMMNEAQELNLVRLLPFMRHPTKLKST